MEHCISEYICESLYHIIAGIRKSRHNTFAREKDGDQIAVIFPISVLLAR